MKKIMDDFANSSETLYAVEDCPLCLSLANHPGILTKEDIEKNLRKAIQRSNKYGEDWIQDLDVNWYQRPGIIPQTEDEELEDEKVIEYQINEMLDTWGENESKAWAILHTAGFEGELKPLTEEQKIELEEQDDWTLSTVLSELPYESPYY